jgi:septal ring factor EnvC (AmiA/AmiB activator)
MPRLSTITYDDVARTATAQLASGVSPTNQSIKTVLNGSFTTIAPLLKRWKQEHQQPAQQATGLPDAVAAVIQQEIARQVQEATAALNTELAEATATNEGLTKENQDAATEVTDITEQLATANKAIAKNDGTINELRQQLEDAKTMAAKAIGDLNTAKIEVARGETYKELVDLLKTQLALIQSANNK